MRGVVGDLCYGKERVRATIALIDAGVAETEFAFVAGGAFPVAVGCEVRTVGAEGPGLEANGRI